jgi:nitrite reductase/ring-hydroxylating ferredoxin subunit
LKYLIGILLLSISVFWYACSKDQESPIPSVPVNINLSLDDPAFNNLNAVGGTAYIDGGIRGIIIYRKGVTEYNAFDRACSYQTNDSCAYVSLDSSISFVGCRCCGSRYQLYDGSPTVGPANAALRAYRTSLQGRNLLIYN